MSNLNEDGRRYSLRVAGEEAPPSEVTTSDPFEHNDLSNILIPLPQSTTTPTSSTSNQSSNQQRQPSTRLPSDDDLSLATDNSTFRDFLDDAPLPAVVNQQVNQ